VAVPSLDRIGGHSQGSIEACDRLCIAAQPAEKVTEQIMRLDVLRFGAKNGFAKPYRIVELAGLKCRHRVRKSAIHRRSSSQHFARSPFKIRLFAILDRRPQCFISSFLYCCCDEST
jgi:hypothetical protein